MVVIAFLNERSYLISNASDEDARKSVERFIDVAIQLRKILPRVALIAALPLTKIPLSDTYSIEQWIGGAARDRRSFLLSLANHAPFSKTAELLPEVDAIVYAYFEGAPFHGLALEAIGLADLYKSFSISFDLDKHWCIPLVPIRSNKMGDYGSVTQRLATVPHVCLTEHCEIHRELLVQIGRTSSDLVETWGNRADLFPYLRFLPKVEGDLQSIDSVSIPQVLDWLFKMNDCIFDWIRTHAVLPQYPPHTTDESETRRNYCWFQDGVDRQCFGWHGRFTPGAGRIHFRLSAPEQKAVVGYIGRKLDRKLVR